ncbi:hypothetical protein BVRB_6g143260 [Beta vulgaris subsp. vulgaris]|nr:hypothetical protein BVRB_6g143260 [Beta vulgaris subsp. vulgaris]
MELLRFREAFRILVGLIVCWVWRRMGIWGIVLRIRSPIIIIITTIIVIIVIVVIPRRLRVIRWGNWGFRVKVIRISIRCRIRRLLRLPRRLVRRRRRLL